MKYIKGDLFDSIPQKDVITFVPHIVNNIGAWGKGFVVPLGQKYPKVKQEYLAMKERILGDVQFVDCDDVIICNMVGQNGIGRQIDGTPPIRYEALQKAMNAVKDKILELQKIKTVEIVAPLFGAGLAGGDWTVISEMISSIWSKNGIVVKIYYLPQFLPKGIVLE